LSEIPSIPPMTYIRDEHREEYRRFVSHHIVNSYARGLPPELWHYTNANGLIAIIKTGTLYATQITCLNDNLEQRYFGDLVHEAVIARRAQGLDDRLRVLSNLANEALSIRDFSTAWHFVTCFSEAEDDLGQWRGYGGGECGYCIGFDSSRLLEGLARRPGTLLVPMLYDLNKQKLFVQDVVRTGEQYFLQGIDRGNTDLSRWAFELFTTLSIELDIFASATKHPSFSSEKERRIVTAIRQDELKQIEFSQKRTLLARHLPINWTGDDGRLPISRLFVGPAPAQAVTRVSVDCLLKKHDYVNIPVELSRVPYRVP
jgi:Protein of unknown function (DUF2971)